MLETDNTWFTLLSMNTQQVHFDAAYAGKTEWKKLLVDSTITLAMLTGMSVRTVSAKVVANLGWDKVKATHPVFAGDTLYAESTILRKRESKSRPTQGIVTVSTRGLNQDGVEVMSFERTMLVLPPRPFARGGGRLLTRRHHHVNERSLIMDPRTLYRSKLTDAAAAARSIASGSNVSMGMAMSEPPALLEAFAARARAGAVDDVKLYYYESTSIAGDTVLAYELNERIHPYCMFMTGVERKLVKRGIEDNRKVVSYVPSTFHQAPRLLVDHIGIDTFLVTVAPMDRHGYFSLGLGNDYSRRRRACGRSPDRRGQRQYCLASRAPAPRST